LKDRLTGWASEESSDPSNVVNCFH
jgi:hypothetical protein